MDVLKHWWCSACGTFDGPHDDGECSVCFDRDGNIERVEKLVPEGQLTGSVEALRELLAVTDHRTLNEQASGGDKCLCGPCMRARTIIGGQ